MARNGLPIHCTMRCRVCNPAPHRAVYGQPIAHHTGTVFPGELIPRAPLRHGSTLAPWLIGAMAGFSLKNRNAGAATASAEWSAAWQPQYGA
jgi:hypothetical protein